MITIQREKIDDVLPQMLPIFLVHHEELNVAPSLIPLDPDWDLYRMMESKNKLMCVTARENGHIVSYYTGFLSTLPHSKNIKTNMEDIFWVAHTHRNGTVSVRLFDFVLKLNRELFPDGFFWRTTAKINTAAPKFLERIGFKKFEENYYILEAGNGN